MSYLCGSSHPAFFRSIQVFELPEANGVSVLRGEFDIAAYDDSVCQRAGVIPSDGIRRAVLRRRAEYFAGRYLAGCLLAERGYDRHVPVGIHRQPVWPIGLRGSISHCGDVAFVALAEESHVWRIGIDLASWLREDLAESIASTIVSPIETDLLATGGWSYAHAMTLAFSAKESVFKALYPEVRAYFDFDEVVLQALDWNRGRFSLRLNQSVAGKTDPGRGHRLDGCFFLYPDSVLTVIAQ